MAWYLSLASNIQTWLQTIAASAGAGDSGKVPHLNSNGVLDDSFISSNIGARLYTGTAAVAISAGNLININSTGGIRLADKNSGVPAHGYAPAAISSAASGTVRLFSGRITGLTGGTQGAEGYLGAAGAITNAAGVTTTAGHGYQRVGFWETTTVFQFDYDPMVVFG